MSKDDRLTQIPKGSTRTDFRLTKHPADTPRGRLHRRAAAGIRAGHEAKRVSKLSRDDMRWLRKLARRGYNLLHHRADRGAVLITYLCAGLDQSLAALTLLDEVDVAQVSDGLTVTLMQLEAAESAIDELKKSNAALTRELAWERGHNDQLRRALAAEQVRAAAALMEVPAERWEEPTRNSSLTEEQMRELNTTDES